MIHTLNNRTASSYSYSQPIDQFTRTTISIPRRKWALLSPVSILLLPPSASIAIQPPRSCLRNIQYSDNITNNISNNVKFILDCFPWSRRLVLQSLNVHSSRARTRIIRGNGSFKLAFHRSIVLSIALAFLPRWPSTRTRETRGSRLLCTLVILCVFVLFSVPLSLILRSLSTLLCSFTAPLCYSSFIIFPLFLFLNSFSYRYDIGKLLSFIAYRFVTTHALLDTVSLSFCLRYSSFRFSLALAIHPHIASITLEYSNYSWNILIASQFRSRVDAKRFREWSSRITSRRTRREKFLFSDRLEGNSWTHDPRL